MVFEIISTDGEIRINSLLLCIDQKFYVFRNLIYKKDYHILLKKFNYFLNEKRTKDVIAFIKFLFFVEKKKEIYIRVHSLEKVETLSFENFEKILCKITPKNYIINL